MARVERQETTSSKALGRHTPRSRRTMKTASFKSLCYDPNTLGASASGSANCSMVHRRNALIFSWNGLGNSAVLAHVMLRDARERMSEALILLDIVLHPMAGKGGQKRASGSNEQVPS
eukprot:5087538-Amphidinium_carterae.1